MAPGNELRVGSLSDPDVGRIVGVRNAVGDRLVGCGPRRSVAGGSRRRVDVDHRADRANDLLRRGGGAADDDRVVAANIVDDKAVEVEAEIKAGVDGGEIELSSNEPVLDRSGRPLDCGATGEVGFARLGVEIGRGNDFPIVGEAVGVGVGAQRKLADHRRHAGSRQADRAALGPDFVRDRRRDRKREQAFLSREVKRNCGRRSVRLRNVKCVAVGEKLLGGLCAIGARETLATDGITRIGRVADAAEGAGQDKAISRCGNRATSRVVEGHSTAAAAAAGVAGVLGAFRIAAGAAGDIKKSENRHVCARKQDCAARTATARVTIGVDSIVGMRSDES